MIAKITLLLLIAVTLFATPFEKGNSFYQEGLFDSAYSSYQEALNQIGPSTTLYYNLGNSSYRLGNIGEAILYYEKAKRLSPTDREVLKNLAFMQTQTVDELPESDNNLIFSFVETIHNAVSLRGQLWFLFLGSLLFVSFLWFILFRKGSHRNWSIYGISGVILLLIVVALSAGTKIYNLENQQYGIILTEKVDASSQPEGTKTLFTIHEGTKFLVRRESTGWLLIGLENGVSGWVNRDSVGIIK